MSMLMSIVGLIGLTLTSAAAGMFVCSALWYAFRLVRHPEWGPVLVVLPIVLALADKLPDSEFLRRSLVFAAIFAGPFSIAGLAWRLGLRERDRATAGLESDPRRESYTSIEKMSPSNGYARYPAITGCICEDRRPSPGEVKRVALRIWHEALVARGRTPTFRERRIVIRAARAALEGIPIH
jgi:hypothetical protein